MGGRLKRFFNEVGTFNGQPALAGDSPLKGPAKDF